MSKREAISRYNLIINRLRKQPSSFNEISDYLKVESDIQSYNFTISKRTFQRDLQDIYSIYNIEIKYNFTKKVYFINYDDEAEINGRILEAFDTFNALNVSDRISENIYFEKRKPAGTENLYGVLHAIKNKLVVKFVYQKFWEEKSSIRKAEPYALKEYNRRWYVLAKDLRDNKTKTFALDRLSSLEISKYKFSVPENLNVEDIFRYCFGIITTNQEHLEEIHLSFTPFQGKYIRTLPLHETQKILVDNENELLVSLKVFITQDLIMELLSFGNNMKVIKPQSLIEIIKKEHEKAFKNY